jgi:hypothetical protein
MVSKVDPPTGLIILIRVVCFTLIGAGLAVLIGSLA